MEEKGISSNLKILRSLKNFNPHMNTSKSCMNIVKVSIDFIYWQYELFFYIDNLIPPSDEFADVHDRVKYFCGVTNEELLDKLKAVEERVLKSEWSGRIKDAKEKMAKLYEENKEFLSKYKKQQEDKVNNLLDENRELIENMKSKASSFDQMMEKTVCDAI